MSAVVTGAFEAVKLANKVTGSKDSDSKIGDLKGRKVRHWSYYLLLTGAALGVAAIVAASILKIILLIVCGSILFVTNGIGAYYVRKFETFKELEDYVEVMTTKINELYDYLMQFKRVNRELKQTADELDENLDETVEVWEHGYNSIKSEAAEIDSLTTRLEITTKQLKKMEEMYQTLQKGLNNFSNEIVVMTENRKDINDKVSDLANQVTGAKDVLTSINSEKDKIEENNALYDQLNKKYLEFLEELQKELKAFLLLHADAQNLTQTLGKQGDALVKVNDQIADSLKKIEDMGAEVQVVETKVQKDGAKLLRKTEKMTQALTVLVENINKIEGAST